MPLILMRGRISFVSLGSWKLNHIWQNIFDPNFVTGHTKKNIMVFMENIFLKKLSTNICPI